MILINKDSKDIVYKYIKEPINIINKTSKDRYFFDNR